MKIGTTDYLPLSGGTLRGDINLGAYRLLTTNLLLREGAATEIYIRNVLDNAFLSMRFLTLNLESDLALVNSVKSFFAPNVDGGYTMLKARDTGGLEVEIARMVGAADPYFQSTLPLRLSPIATGALPATPVEGMIAYNDTLKRLTYRDNASWQTLNPVYVVRKTADEIVNNSAALQNDNHLLLALAANEVWIIDLTLILGSDPAPDFKMDCTIPVGANGYMHTCYIDAAAAQQIAQSSAAEINVLTYGGATPTTIRIAYLIVNGVNAGNFQIRWAQNTADATDTIVLTNSNLICHKIL